MDWDTTEHTLDELPDEDFDLDYIDSELTDEDDHPHIEWAGYI